MKNLISVQQVNDKLKIKIYGSKFRRYLRLIKTLPRREFDGKHWVVPSVHAQLLVDTIGEENIAWLTPLHVIRGTAIDTPDPLEGVPISTTGTEGLPITIPEYQIEGASFLIHKRRALLADDMGVGKTITAGVALRRGILEGSISRALVVCPSSVKLQWEEELRDKLMLWDTTVISGNAKRRCRQWGEGSNIVVVNYETLTNDEDLQLALAFNPDVIIVDEAHYIKNPSAERTKAIFKVNPRYKWLLTGTPLENKPDEIFNLMKYINPKILGGIREFEKRHVVKMFLPDRRIKVPIGYRNLHEVHIAIAPWMLRRLKEDVLEHLPQRREISLRVTLTRTQEILHQGYTEEIKKLQSIQPKNDYQRQQLEDRILGQLQYLIEVCDSPLLVNKKEMNDSKSPKLTMLLDILLTRLESNSQSKVVVFTQFRGMQRLIQDELDRAGILYTLLHGEMNDNQRHQSKLRFNTEPDVKVFLTTDAGKEGLNLQIADTLVNVDLPWKPSTYNQRIGRIERMGSVFDEILVVNLIATSEKFEVVDERMWNAIKEKQELFDIVVEGK